MVQHFYNQRRPRQFDHKPIYWDPEKERLEKRIQKVRKELEAAGEIEADESSADNLSNSSKKKPTEYSTDHIKGSFLDGTSHLRRQKERGIGRYERQKKNIKLIIILIGLAVLAWILFFRENSFLA